MRKIASKHSKVFEGMGHANVEPIHIHMKEGVELMQQGKRPIPHQFKIPVQNSRNWWTMT